MKKTNHLTLGALAFFLCANFSMNEDETSISGGGIKPTINFKGAIQDNTGKEFEAAHITISGLYKQIPVYSKPQNMKNDKYDPTINTVRLDLAEVEKISVPQPNDIHIFNNRKYIEIEVTSKSKIQTTNNYLIENSKKILCDQVNTAGPIERELQFPAIQKIVISHYEKTDPEIKKPSPPATKSIKETSSSKPTERAK